MTQPAFTSSQALAEIAAQTSSQPVHAWQSPMGTLVHGVLRMSPHAAPLSLSLSLSPLSSPPDSPIPETPSPPPILGEFADDLTRIIRRFFADHPVGAPLGGDKTAYLFDALTQLCARMQSRQ